jgi:AcrR family transcriptional regulator
MAERNAERTKAAEHTRDAERTKEAILVAAEHRFARLGFHGTSLQQIGEAAGVARSTPAYFFRSKEALYDSVLARAVARAQGAMARAYAEQDAGRSAEEAVESYVGAFLDFLGHDQNFVRLIQREALEEESRVAGFFGRSVEEALAALEPAAKKAGIPPQRLVLDLAALCWYPFAHEHTLLPALGMKARDPTFLAEQKRHLGDLVRAMTRAERQRRSRRQRS